MLSRAAPPLGVNQFDAAKPPELLNVLVEEAHVGTDCLADLGRADDSLVTFRQYMLPKRVAERLDEVGGMNRFSKPLLTICFMLVNFMSLPPAWLWYQDRA